MGTYRTNRYPITPQKEKEGRFLISLSPQQELACFLAQRAYCWLDLENFREAAFCFIRSSALDLENKLAAVVAANVLDQWHQTLKSQLPPNFPELDIQLPPRRIPNAPQWVESLAIRLETTQNILQKPQHQSWWKSLRQSPNARPPNIPSKIRVLLAR